MTDYCIMPGGKLHGSVCVPGDKSISHRALMLSAIAEGQSRIKGFLHAHDTLMTMKAFLAMGVSIQEQDNVVIITGVGKDGLSVPSVALDMGNSGTAVRLLAGLLAGAGIVCEFIGDQSLMSRPMLRVVDALQKMEADITCVEGGTLPMQVHGKTHLEAIDFTLPVASAQLKSSLLLAGLYAHGTTFIHEPIHTRDHTERMLRQFDVQIDRVGDTISMVGEQTLHGTEIDVPVDISSAAFFIVGACIAKDSDITIKNVGVNPYRNAIIEILRAMGADITLFNEREFGTEPIADIRVRYMPLHGITIGGSWVPAAIDEIPAIMIAGACAKGQTILTDAGELRVKESDRIASITAGLQTLGIDVVEHAEGMIVTGGQMLGGEIDSFDDHRIAMAFSIAGLCATSAIIVKNCDNVETSFPNFVEVAQHAGLQLNVNAI